VVIGRAAASVWAKSAPYPPEVVQWWLPLHQHLDDARGVAERLVEEWLPRQVVERIAVDLPDGCDGVRRVAGWLAAVHDVGKASPVFAVQVPVLCDRMARAGLPTDPRVGVSRDRSSVRHELVGCLAVQDWLHRVHGFAWRGIAQQLAVVVGSHHGVPPEESQLQVARESGPLAGVGPWTVVRDELLEGATTRCGGEEALDGLRAATLSLPSQVLLTAIVIMADWIASSTDLFPLDPVHLLGDVVPLQEGPVADRSAYRLERAWAALDLPRPWRPGPLVGSLDRLLGQRFAIAGATARPVQRAAVEAAVAQTRPGMVIVEAPMGEGKTEAALLVVEELASRSGAGGCFIALPTQATSDAMFVRALHWVRALPREAADGPASVFLAHGKAVLNEEFRGLRPGARFASIGVDGDAETAVAHWWFGGRKKGVLASFVVGTVDQVLFAGLKSRHLMLRHLALAGKVVVIDEVHAYDVYMSQYLDRVLQWLGAYRVPVVLLSATLPAARRAQLLAAYDPDTELAPSVAYPVVTGTHGAGQRAVTASPRGIEVQLAHVEDDLDTLVGLLRARLVDGGCAVVIRNTVGRVQDTAERLEAELGEDQVTIAHSRFLSCDRARIDRGLLRHFGPPGPGVTRPRMHVVVASQVVEQSLDIDFDLMVTDLAPTDLVLQRTGRLYRHVRERPAGVRTPWCVLAGVESWTEEPVRAVPGSRAVYDEHTLLRSAALLGPPRQTISLPGEISPLVQAAYGAGEVCPAAWAGAVQISREKAEQRARVRVEAAQHFILGTSDQTKTMIGWVRAGVGDVDDDAVGSAQVRDGADSLEVVVVQSDGAGGLRVPDWIERNPGAQIPLFGPLSSDLSRILAACTLRLPPALCYPGVIDDVITALESAGQVDSFFQSPTLKGQLVLVLDPDRTAVLQHRTTHFRLVYDPRWGLSHERL